MTHMVLRFVVPAIVAGLFFRKNWQSAYFVEVLSLEYCLKEIAGLLGKVRP